jgi:hypothetical protein
MGPGIVIPIIVIAVIAPLGFSWARKRFKEPGSASDDDPVTPALRLTSGALRALDSPPWRIVYEIAHDRLGGVEHVAIGASGAYAIVTSMDPVPPPASDPPDPHRIAEASIRRGGLDDALRRCAMSSERLVIVHWGVNESPVPPSGVETIPGVTAVDGRQLAAWASTAGEPSLTQAQVDLAWQTVVTAIGRPDPLS